MQTALKIDTQDHKPAQYYANPRWDYIRALSEIRPTRVLELGCGNGATGARALEQGLCCEYVGIEICSAVAQEARKVLTAVHIGDVDELTLPYEVHTFDAFIASEVLEHLRAPERTLQRILSLVRPGGVILASSPNIAWYRNVLNLLRGRFEYTESGMMDRTHLRWFTPNSFASMFQQLGVEIDNIGPINPATGVTRFLDLATLNRFPHLFWYQINIRGHKAQVTGSSRS
jgi:SAM-dependent methyltransferase